MKARQKADRRWAKKRPVYAKHAGKTTWVEDDSKPRVPGGGPKRKR